MADEKNEIISPFMEEMREKINDVDNAILELLNKRAEYVREVGNWKKENQKKVYDEKREDSIIARLQEMNEGPLHNDSLERIFRNIIFEYRTNEHIELDRESHRVTRNGRQVHLGPTEFRLLEFLMQSPGRVFSRAQLLDGVWGRNVYVDERTVDVHIGRLRKAMMRGSERDPVRTVRGAGYAFSDKLEETA